MPFTYITSRINTKYSYDASQMSFLSPKYTQAVAYEKHLRTTHTNLSITLTCSIRYPLPDKRIVDTETDVVRQCPDPDYKSNPEPTRHEHDILANEVIYESDTEILNKTASLTSGQKRYFLGTGEPIRDLNRFEHKIHNLCHNPWAAFPNGQGFRLAF